MSDQRMRARAISGNWNISGPGVALAVAVLLLALWPEMRQIFGNFGTLAAISCAIALVIVIFEPAPGGAPTAGMVAAAQRTQNIDMMEILPVALLRLDSNGTITKSNAAARTLIGAPNLGGVKLESLAEGLGRSIHDRISEAVRGNVLRRSEMARFQRSGQEVFIQVALMSELDGGGGLIAVLSDKTELKALEAQFVQSQKMQAVGQLAGGVAHDFNNLLTAIGGHADLLLLRHETGDTDYGDLIQIRQNTLRAAALVKQLLAFSRKQTLQPKVLNLTDTLSELTHLLNRLLGEKVVLEIDHDDTLWPVRVDERQMEQVIMNLVVNARDAMPAGGKVCIRSENITLSIPLHRNRAIVPAGRYVVLSVSDLGCGIEPDELEKIFEPFYTTKRVGEGTGLGLSTAYGIIKQTGGFIFADSKLGVGTVFSLYLPAHETVAQQAPATTPAVVAESETNFGRILLVEDEDAVRAFALRALRLKGFDVDEAESGEAALALLQQPNAHYDLFITDVIMPGLDGPSWVRKARENFPKTKVVFMSGYADDIFKDGQPAIDDAQFLAKPFSLKELTQLAGRILSR